MDGAQGSDVLGADEFVTAMVDGACAYHPADWAEALRRAVEAVSADRPGAWEVSALGGLLRTASSQRRASISPFDGVMEAPPSIIDVYQAHHAAIDDLREHRARVLEPVVRDLAASMFARIDGPLPWAELVELGTVRDRPAQPESDWD